MGCCHITEVSGDHSPTSDYLGGRKEPGPKKSVTYAKDVVSNEPKGKSAEPRSTGLLSPEEFIINLTFGKPLDASDVDNFSSAKDQIKSIRKYAQKFLDSVPDEGVSDDVEKQDANTSARFALYEKEDVASFRKETIQKSDASKKLIIDAIKPNVLFEHDTEEEIRELVDVFKPVAFKAGDVVITQGDKGDEFFVIESGKLSIQVTVGDGKDKSEVKVGTYGVGNAFGELALIFGSPRAATITAMTDAKLWKIDRQAYRSVISQLRFQERQEKIAFLRSCEVNGRRFTEVFDAAQIEDLTIAIKTDMFKPGDIILREGEKNDTFYIVRSGIIETYRKGFDERVGVFCKKQAFGIEALLKNSPSTMTHIAASAVSVYYLTKHDFDRMVGGLQDAIDGKSVSRVSNRLTKMESRKTLKTSMTTDTRYVHDLTDLTFFNVLGKGAFGKVKLVQAKETKKVFALKALGKNYIEIKGQKEHVLNEYRLLNEIDHPNIIKIHCAMQDDRYIYFLFDLLPGGELMKHFLRRGKFSEDTTRFYAASVVLAFEEIHTLMIAYRDLKPENMVLDRKGFCILVDFGLAKEIDEGQTFTFCGTPDYLAPEIIRGTGHDWGVDYWGLGILLFELTYGSAPFYANNQSRRTRKILKGYDYVKPPSDFSGALNSLISSLLVSDQSKRLGRTQNGVQAIKNHRWFAGFDWDGLYERRIPVPIDPKYPSDIKKLGKQDNTPDIAPISDWNPNFDSLF